MRGIKLSKQNFNSVLERTLHSVFQKAVFSLRLLAKNCQNTKSMFSLSVSSDLCAAPVEYRSFSVRLISEEEKEPVLASSSSLGQEQTHSGAETLNTHTLKAS